MSSVWQIVKLGKQYWQRLVFFGSCLLILIGYQLSPLADIVEQGVIRPFEFRLRDALSLAPNLDQRLKVFSYTPSPIPFAPSNQDLLAMLTKIAERQPRAIYIDRVWLFFNSSERLELPINFDVPIIVGSRVAPFAWFSELLVDVDSDSFITASSGDNLPFRVGIPYSLDNQQLLAISSIGHDEVQGRGYIYPLLSFGSHLVSSSPYIVPHVAVLTVQRRLKISDGQVVVNGLKIPVNRQGTALINFANYHQYLTNKRSLNDIDLNPNLLSDIDKDSIVAILPEKFLATTSIRDSFVGEVESAFFTLSFLNSLIAENWFTPLPFGWLVVVMLVLLAMSLGKFWIRWLVQLAIVSVGLLAFVFLDVLTPWYLWVIAFYFGGYHWLLTISSNRIREHNVDGAEEHLITVMFIDMVGFAMSSEGLTPKTALGRLSDNLGYLTEKIHQYGGSINKTLGDGLLAYFGYPNAADADNHAESALSCAIDIQRDCLGRCDNHCADESPLPDSKSFTYPLRIGVNTDLVYVGRVGDDREIALVGGAVVFAARLESSCEPFRIMLGNTTKELLSDGFLKNNCGLNKRWIKIKHYEKLFEAYEYNPFVGDLFSQSQAKKAYRRFLNLDRKSDRQRWVIADRTALTMYWGKDSAVVLNISHCGFAIETDRYLAKGVIIEVMIRSAIGLVNDNLQKSGLIPLRVEVKWGQPLENRNKFRQGVRVVGFNREQGEALLNICQGVLVMGSRAGGG